MQIHSFLVHPDKHADEPTPVRGTNVSLSGRLYEMLRDVFDKSPTECNTDISFDPNVEGQQQNDCRDLLLEYVKEPNTGNGRAIANRLAEVSTHKSGMGLLFLMLGSSGKVKRLVVSRFPADSAILAEEGDRSLTVQFLEKVFMKSATAYKSAVYEGASLAADFWAGRAVDKQINSRVSAVSNYWIRHFLLSDFKTTGPTGTRRLAIAVKNAVNHSDDLSVKEQLTAASKLVTQLGGKTTSGKDFAEKYSLSGEAREAIRKEFVRDDLYEERFRFTHDEYVKHISYRTIELDTGGVLTADSESFDDVFVRENYDDETGEASYRTKGKVVDNKLRNVK